MTHVECFNVKHHTARQVLALPSDTTSFLRIGYLMVVNRGLKYAVFLKLFILKLLHRILGWFKMSKCGNATFTGHSEWCLHHILSVISFTVALNVSFASFTELKILVDFLHLNPGHVTSQ